jgi:CheY-like chemotaxis protein
LIGPFVQSKRFSILAHRHYESRPPIMTKALPPKSLVLYADDDTDDIELVRDLFAPYESLVELVTFPDGKALLDYLHQLPPLQPQPCLVILDVNMPVMDGMQTLKTLRLSDDLAEVPVVLFTTSNLPNEAAYADRFGAGFITKPVHQDQLSQLVDRMLHFCSDAFRKKLGRGRK